MVDKNPPTDIVNLRKARKQRDRAESSRAADANRIKHGLSKATTSLAEARKAKAARDLDAHKRQDGDDNSSES